MLLPFLASRLLVLCLILLSKLIVVPGPHAHRGGWLSVLVQWDGVRYLDIVRHGYDAAPGITNMAFFPLYPLVVEVMWTLLGRLAVAAVITSNLCLLAAGVLLFELVRIHFDDRKAARLAVIFLMFSPVALFTTSAYPDSLFLLLSVGAMLAAIKGQWVLACLCGMALSATRNFGLLILIPLALEYVRQLRESGASERDYLRRRALLLALVPVGLFAVMFIGYGEYQNPLAFVDAQRALDTRLASPDRPVAVNYYHRLYYWWMLNGSFAVAAALTLAAVFLKLRLSWVVYSGVMIVALAWSGCLDAVPRSLGMVFPLFVCLGVAAARFRALYEPLLGAAVALLVLYTTLAANGFWVR